MTANGASNAGSAAAGVIAQTVNGAISITTGAVTGAGGGLGTLGIVGESTAGSVTITNNGAVQATATGVFATTAAAPITVNANAAVSGTNGIVTNDTTGATNVNANALVTATATNGQGIAAASTSGAITISTQGVTATAGGVVTTATAVQAKSTGGPINVTTNGTVQGGVGGIVTTNTTGATTINANALVTASSAFASGIGASSTTGAITINTQAVTANGGGTGSMAFGVSASSTSGVVSITTNGAVQGGALGVAATTGGAGKATITTNATVTASNGSGILANSGTGGSFVNVGGAVTATDANNPFGGFGVTASSSGVVNVVVTGGATITSTGAKAQAGIAAAGGTGVTVDTTAGGAVSGQTTGILTTDTAGPTVITTGGAVTGTTVDGINATTTGTGPITITTNGVVTGAVNGVSASGAGGAVTVTNNAAVTGTSGKGINATDTGAGAINVVVSGPVKDAVGVFTAQTGTGVTNIVDTSAANTVQGTLGDGIQSVNGAGTGAVNVGSGPGSRFVANVTGATNGIDISGAGAMNVFTSSVITGGAGWGILAQSTGAPVTIDVTGNVTGTASGGVGGGIKGATSGANAVSITAASTVTGLGAGSNGIDGESSGAGAVSIASSGPLVTGANDAIFAKSVGGTINVGTVAAPITSVLGDATTKNAGIETSNTTGATNVNTAASASMTGDVNAKFGILTNATSGLTTINNAAAITVNGTDISANASAGGVIVIASSGTLNATTGDGIDAFSSGAGNGAITIGTVAAPLTSNITAAGNGINAQGNGVIGIVDNGTVTAAGTWGIEAISSSGAVANQTVSVTANGNVKGKNGVLGKTTGTDAGDTVTVNLNAPTITATAGTGAAAVGVGGVVTVNLNAGTVSSTGGDGLVAVSSGVGNVVVNTAAGTTINTSGAGADGIFATATKVGGPATITVNNAATINMANGTDAGIHAVGLGGGQLTVNNTGVIDPAAFGILATNAGNSTVNDSANITAGTGISNTTTGAAPFTAQTTVTGGAVITGLTGDAIDGFGTGGGNVGVDTSQSGNITGAVNGIATAVSGGTGATTIVTLAPAVGGNNLVNSLVVTGQGGNGVMAASSSSGAINVTTGNVVGAGAAGHASSGVVATSSGGGAVSVATVGNVTGDATGNATGVGATGVTAASSGGNVAVTVSAAVTNLVPPPGAAVFTPVTTVVQGGDAGISAATSGAGATTVVVNTLGTGGVVQATGALAVNNGFGPVGIAAFGGTGGKAVGAGTGVSVTVGANVRSANGRGIVTNSGNNAAITVNAGSSVTGLGDATAAFGGSGTTTHAVIDVTAVSGAVTTLTNAGTVESVAGNTATGGGYGDLALKGTTGGVAVVNTGLLIGRVDESGLTGTNGSTITNAGTWHSIGASVLSPGGADLITNTGVIGTAANGKATSIAFGSGTDTFNNNAGGVLVVGEAPLGGTAAAPSVLTITGAVSFVNAGTIILGSSTTSASDKVIDAALRASGTTLSGSGLIDLDANLWSDVQTAANCNAALTAADCLVVKATSGNNGIRVSDTGAHAFGAYNPTGITVVVGSSGASTFHLDAGSSFYDGNAADSWMFGGHTGVLNKPGMFFYDLSFFAADSTERLVGVPKASAFEFPSLGGAVEGVWHMTTQTWFDRTADLRDGLDQRAEGHEPAVWLKIVGDWTNRSHSDSLTLGSQTYTFNTSYNQDTSAIIGGVDLLNVTDKDKAFVLGLEGGEANSDIRFKGSPDRYTLSGGDFGGYVTFLSGGLFIDGAINANFMKLAGNLPGLGGNPASTPPTLIAGRVNVVGGQIEAGYQMPIGGTWFWEPTGLLTYSNASFDQMGIPGSGGGSLTLSNDRSFQGALGVRIGGEQTSQYYRVKLALDARIWDEFDGTTNASLAVPAGPNFGWSNSIKGVFGEVQGEANLFTTTSGLSAFLNGGWRFKNAYSEATITLGARYQW